MSASFQSGCGKDGEEGNGYGYVSVTWVSEAENRVDQDEAPEGRDNPSRYILLDLEDAVDPAEQQDQGEIPHITGPPCREDLEGRSLSADGQLVSQIRRRLIHDDLRKESPLERVCEVGDHEQHRRKE